MVAFFLLSQLIPVSVGGEERFVPRLLCGMPTTHCSLLFCLHLPETEVVMSEVICQSDL